MASKTPREMTGAELRSMLKSSNKNGFMASGINWIICLFRT